MRRKQYEIMRTQYTLEWDRNIGFERERMTLKVTMQMHNILGEFIHVGGEGRPRGGSPLMQTWTFGWRPLCGRRLIGGGPNFPLITLTLRLLLGGGAWTSSSSLGVEGQLYPKSCSVKPALYRLREENTTEIAKQSPWGKVWCEPKSFPGIRRYKNVFTLTKYTQLSMF